ncbi:MAG: N-acetyltransferase family protein [Bacteroidota bacterium]
MGCTFNLATTSDIPGVWDILQHAIERRRADGSNQWQDGYPNPAIIKKDIARNEGFVLTNDNDIIGYAAVMINDEPQYENIDGSWLTTGDFVAYHRVAIAPEYLGQGYAKKLIMGIHDYAKENAIASIKADTNFDNPAMLRIFDKLGYTYCGEVLINGSPRRAYEKVLR